MSQGYRRFRLIAVAPAGTRPARVFVNGCVRVVDETVYPASPRGEQLRPLRLKLGLTLRAAAQILQVSAFELSGLQTGRLTLESEQEWDRAEQFLRAAKGGKP